MDFKRTRPIQRGYAVLPDLTPVHDMEVLRERLETGPVSDSNLRELLAKAVKAIRIGGQDFISKASNKQTGDKIFSGADKVNTTFFQCFHKPAGVQGIPGQTPQLSHHQGVHPLFSGGLHNCGKAGTVWTDAATCFGGFTHNGIV